jgi:hypothetical protein
VFTCRHGTFSDIPDGEHATREKTAGLVANDFFKDWQHDADFIKEYNDTRCTVLKHHRAHKAIGQERADWASNLRNELLRIDTVRGVTATYH